MKVLITGADGFIGSHLTEFLVKKGHEVTAMCYYNSFNSIGNLNYLDKKILKNINIVHGDVRDTTFVENLTRRKNFVFHLAALIGIPYSYKAYQSYVDTNINGTLNILNAIKKNNCYLVHTSTSEVYGSAKFWPMRENHPINAQSPYAATKIGADQLAMSFFRSFSLPITILRPFNTYGPRQSMRAVIPTIINQILSGKRKIQLGNISSRRDLTYIDDTVDGFYKCIGKSKLIAGEVINLGTGFDVSIKEIVKIIEYILKVKITVDQSKQRIRPIKSEVDKLLSSNKKAKKLLNWSPKFKNKKMFIEGLKKTISWYKEDHQISEETKKYFI